MAESKNSDSQTTTRQDNARATKEDTTTDNTDTCILRHASNTSNNARATKEDTTTDNTDTCILRHASNTSNNARATKEDTTTDNTDTCILRHTNNTSNNAAEDIESVQDEEDVSDEPASIKFHEVIGYDSTEGGAEAYINYVLANYEPANPECIHYLDIIRSSLTQQQFCSHFENIVESSTSHSQTCDFIREVVDDVLQDLFENNIEMSSPLTSSEEEFLQTILTNRILRQQVNTHVAKIIQRAVKQLELEVKRSGFKAGDKVFSIPGLTKTWSLENMNGETPVPGTVDTTLEESKVEETQPMYAHLPRYLPAYRPHKDISEYVPIPCLYNLPAYTKAPFPVRLQKHMSPSSWRTTKLGHSTYAVPTFDLSQGTTQVFSKLIKYYNSLK